MSNKWIAAWGCPISRPTYDMSQWMHDTTVRFNIFMTVSGSALRFHFSNLFGDTEATVTRATVAHFTRDSSVDLSTVTDITFGGGESGKMPPAGNITSDEIPFDFSAGDTVTVSLYFADFTKLSTAFQKGNDEFTQKWVAGGDLTHTADLPTNENAEARAYPFIHTVDALCDDSCYSIVAFGDSITAQSWPDRLARRIHSLGIKNVAVVRKAISGSRVLREYPCTQYYNYGPRGLDRFPREVLCAGVKKVFILHGINDIIHPNGTYFRPMSDQPTANELVDGLKFYIDTARENGIEVYMSPILPFKGWRTYNDEKNAIRLVVNDWIKNSADIDGVIPFDTAVQDKDDPLAMLAVYDSGDHLHPSGDGAQAMADSISEEII